MINDDLGADVGAHKLNFGAKISFLRNFKRLWGNCRTEFSEGEYGGLHPLVFAMTFIKKGFSASGQ